MLTLEEVLPHFDGKKSLLAQRLGISRQAVSRWAMNDAIPEKHELKLRHEILGQAGQDVKVDKSQPRAKIEVDSSRKLDNVLYEIRGPVLEEAYR
jgi:hypothetical protein